MLAEIAAAAEVEPASMPTAVDGCGVVTFALTLERMAHAFSRLEALDGGARAADAMRAHPELIRGDGAPDTELMRLGDGWVAKGGAEGLLCAASRRARHRAQGRGRRAAADPPRARVRSSRGSGSRRATSADAPVENSRGEIVGELRVHRTGTAR